MTAILSWTHGDMVEGESWFSWAVLWPPHMRMVHVHPNTCACTINEWYIIIVRIKISGIKSNWDFGLPQVLEVIQRAQVSVTACRRAHMLSQRLMAAWLLQSLSFWHSFPVNLELAVSTRLSVPWTLDPTYLHIPSPLGCLACEPWIPLNYLPIPTPSRC